MRNRQPNLLGDVFKFRQRSFRGNALRRREYRKQQTQREEITHDGNSAKIISLWRPAVPPGWTGQSPVLHQNHRDVIPAPGEYVSNVSSHFPSATVFVL